MINADHCLNINTYRMSPEENTVLANTITVVNKSAVCYINTKSVHLKSFILPK